MKLLESVSSALSFLRKLLLEFFDLQRTCGICKAQNSEMHVAKVGYLRAVLCDGVCMQFRRITDLW